MRVYIILNTELGWKVVKEEPHIDTADYLEIFEELEDAENFCKENNLEIIRICR